MAQIYDIEVVRQFKLSEEERARFDEWRLLVDERVLVGTLACGGPLEARRVHWMKLIEKGGGGPLIHLD